MDMELEKFLNDIPGQNGPTGAFLKYLPEYETLRSIRKQDEDFFPASLKSGNNYNKEWHRLSLLCESALTHKTKDFQIAIWLMEGWFYCHGLDGVVKGVKLLLLLVDRFWEMGYPPLEEDLEYRLSPFVWVNEKFCDKFVFIKLTDSNFIDDRPYSYADWIDMKHVEILIQKSKNPNAAKDRAAKEGKVTPELFEKGFARTPVTLLKENLEKILTLKNDIQELDEKIDRLTRGRGVSFVRLKKIVEDIRHVLQTHIPPEPEPVVEVIEPEIVVSAEPLNPSESPEGPLPEPVIIEHRQEDAYSRDIAYEELERIATFLSSIEHQNPAIPV